MPSDLRGTKRRRGSITLELLFVLPVAMVVLLATIEFSMILTARQHLSAASREGARVSALGGSAEEAEAAARLYLGSGRLALATVEVFDLDSNGDPQPSGEPVAVRVRIPTGLVVPDLLAIIGFSIRGDMLAAQTVMRRE